MPVRPQLQLNTTEKLAVTISSLLMFLVFGVLCFFSDRRPPSQHLPIVTLSDTSIVLAGYEIGRQLTVPECPFSKKESGATYDYTLRATCFERLSAGEIGTRVDRPEWIQVEQLDIAKQYDDLDWKQPICVGLVGGKIEAVNVKIDSDTFPINPTLEALRHQLGTVFSDRSSAAQDADNEDVYRTIDWHSHNITVRVAYRTRHRKSATRSFPFETTTAFSQQGASLVADEWKSFKSPCRN